VQSRIAALRPVEDTGKKQRKRHARRPHTTSRHQSVLPHRESYIAFGGPQGHGALFNSRGAVRRLLPCQGRPGNRGSLTEPRLSRSGVPRDTRLPIRKPYSEHVQNKR
jgi:hypothetical protein